MTSRKQGTHLTCNSNCKCDRGGVASDPDAEVGGGAYDEKRERTIRKFLILDLRMVMSNGGNIFCEDTHITLSE